jgi:putative endonuclease
MADHNDLGRKGEAIAKEFLEISGYDILDENWVFGKAEIDLITYRDKQLIFVEVKTRTGSKFGQPEDFVDDAKQRQMQLAAEEYIHLMDFKGEIRFDILSVLFDGQGRHMLRHIEDAFWPGNNL